jgi:hypothetical protein
LLQGAGSYFDKRILEFILIIYSGGTLIQDTADIFDTYIIMEVVLIQDTGNSLDKLYGGFLDSGGHFLRNI